MGAFSLWHWVIILAIALLLFGGGGRVPTLMGDIARGIRKFKKGLSDEDEDADQRHPLDTKNRNAGTVEHKRIDELSSNSSSDSGIDNPN